MALLLNPAHFDALHMSGVIALQQGDPQAALVLIDQALSADSGNAGAADAYINRGAALARLGLQDAAIESYNQALALKPAHADAYFNRGNVFHAIKRPGKALDSYDKAVTADPRHGNAWFNRAIVLKGLKRHQEAAHSYDMAAACGANASFLPGLRLHAKMQICDWTDFDSQLEALCAGIARGEKVTPPLATLAVTDSAALQRRAAEIWTADTCPPNPTLGPLTPRPRNGKIKLAYFSMDFRNHPVATLVAGLIEAHDSEKFEVYAFSYGPDTGDAMRTRLESSFDQFIDIRKHTDRDAAVLAREIGVDIAIDLAGHTTDARTGIFAFRTAPIQVSYLGYPGTMGASYIDYIIADRNLIPADHFSQYSEKVVHLPHFQANDDTREIADQPLTRAALGLPQIGAIFCCFNNTYKITPAVFAGWMRILKAASDATLLLYAENETAAVNLKAEAARHGIAPERLVFGAKLPRPAYLARYQIADLFLDTLPFNAGTTASDSLWAGLPVLTCRGESFAGRMASSLLEAIGLPELITTTPAAYEALAIALAKNPARLSEIRAKLAPNRQTSALFDVKRFARTIENAYVQMTARARAGLPPDHIMVA